MFQQNCNAIETQLQQADTKMTGNIKKVTTKCQAGIKPLIRTNNKVSADFSAIMKRLPQKRIFLQNEIKTS